MLQTNTYNREGRLLHQVAEDYEVDPVYVLDMYRHGKVSWMLDFAVCVGGVGVLLLAVGSVIVTDVKKAFRRKENGE